MWRRIKPGPVVISIFLAGMACVWVTVSIRVVYDVTLDARDVVVSSVLFMSSVGWGADYLLKRES